MRALLESIPDTADQNLTILPFLSDEYGRVTLGDRLKSELELYLAAKYKRLPYEYLTGVSKRVERRYITD